MHSSNVHLLITYYVPKSVDAIFFFLKKKRPIISFACNLGLLPISRVAEPSGSLREAMQTLSLHPPRNALTYRLLCMMEERWSQVLARTSPVLHHSSHTSTMCLRLRMHICFWKRRGPVSLTFEKHSDNWATDVGAQFSFVGYSLFFSQPPPIRA